MANKRHRKNRIVDWRLSIVSLLLSLLVMFSLSVPVAAAILTIKYVDIPKLDASKIDKLPQRTRIYAADKSVLANFYFQNRDSVKLSDVPTNLQGAVIAIEDHRYYEHGGLDIRSISRAFLNNVKSGRVSEGGSTITQQFVKNAFLSNEQSVARKIREAGLSYQLEKKYSKKKILELYLNTIYFGNGAYGAKTAAEIYFAKPLSQLSLEESALLAGLTKSPNEFSPYNHPEAAKKRRNEVLSKMFEFHYINKTEYEQAAAGDIQVIPDQEIGYRSAPYFVDFVRQTIIKKVGAKKFLRGGLNIYTTIDPKTQRYAEESIENTFNRPGDPSASLVSLEPKTGFIRAMVGGKDFRSDEFNLAVQGRRQAGSSFKTFVLVTALKQGLSPNKSFNGSSPVTIRLPKPGPDWQVKNYGNHSYGAIPISEATVKSVNVVYAQLVMEVGANNVVETAKQMGITSPINANPAIALGGLTHGVSPLEMASAYSTLATGGKHTSPKAISKITDRQGHTIYQAKITTKRVLDADIAYQANSILKEVVDRGTGTGANIGRPQAGKTGTSQNLRDAWFVGYTPALSTAVWVGYPHNSVEMNSVHGMSVTGGSFPAHIWKIFMEKALRNIEVADFVGPDGIHTPTVAKTQPRVKKAPALARKTPPPPEPEVAPKPEVAPTPPPPPPATPPPPPESPSEPPPEPDTTTTP